MTPTKKIVASILGLFCLTGCKPPLTYEYLVLHPRVLEQEVQRCQIEIAASCEVVERAARYFSEIIEEYRHRPEALGEQILQGQMNLAKMEQNINQAQREGLQSKVIEEKEAYQTEKLKVQTLLAILSETKGD